MMLNALNVMVNCKFLKQKKQVQINGEWVDTRSYRYLPYCDRGIPSVTIIGCRPNKDVTVYVANSSPKTITLDGNGEGYVLLDKNDSIDYIYIDDDVIPSCEVEISGCKLNSMQVRGANKLTISCSILDRREYEWDREDRSFLGSGITFDVFDTVSIVGPMTGLFAFCKKLTSLDLSSFDTSNTGSMRWMFWFCEKLTSLDLSNFDTSKTGRMTSMFANCSSLTSIDVSSFDTSNVTDMSDMFGGCYSLTSLDLSSFNTSKVTNMGGMFSGCYSLTSLDLSSFNTSKVTNMSGMFHTSSGLTSLDLSNFDVSKVELTTAMFKYCTNLQTLDISSWNFLSDRWNEFSTESDEMFRFCTNLRKIYMRGCNQRTIDRIKKRLELDGILKQVTIIT